LTPLNRRETSKKQQLNLEATMPNVAIFPIIKRPTPQDLKPAMTPKPRPLKTKKEQMIADANRIATMLFHVEKEAALLNSKYDHPVFGDTMVKMALERMRCFREIKKLSETEKQA
jgi:hypothetical protein